MLYPYYDIDYVSTPLGPLTRTYATRARTKSECRTS